MSNPKIHYAICERANESYNRDEWSETACGLEYTESPLTDRKKEVTCKNCLRIIARFESVTPQGQQTKKGPALNDILEIEKLQNGQSYIIPESDYGKAEVWMINDYWLVFSIPNYGGDPQFERAYSSRLFSAERIVQDIYSWT